MQSVTVDSGRRKLGGPSSKAGPKRKHAARIALANAPVRTCIGCREAATRADLVRMVAAPDGEVVFDLSGGSFGRGAWSHPTEVCLRRAAKVMARGQTRLLGSASEPTAEPGTTGAEAPSVTPDALLLALADAANRRAAGLVSAAYRSSHLAMGGDAAQEKFALGQARLVILATDARAAKREVWLETAVTKGLVVAWATKAELGALVGRDELAVMVVTDDGLARSLRQVLALTTPVTSRLAGSALAVARSAVTTMATGSHGLEESEDG